MTNSKDRRRVKDLITPEGDAPHPPRSLALAATNHLQNPPSKWTATSHSQIPHAPKVY
jgi:hypothetical protein